MALAIPKLPNMAKVNAAVGKAAGTPGSSAAKAVGSAGAGYKGWSGGAPAGGGAGKGAPPKVPNGFDPYSGLYLKQADPSTFQTTANQGYTTDVTHASDLANMGMPTNQSLTDAAAARAKGLGDISAALQAHIAQIQQAEVAQGNTIAGQLGAHAAPTPVVPGSPVPTTGDANIPAAQATLAGQTAGTGNLLGTIQASSAQGGAYAQEQALNEGASAVKNNDLLRQKAVASFLSGIASPSARVAGLVSENEKIAAANAATKLSVWNTLQSQIQQDKLSGDRSALARDQIAEHKWEAGQRTNAQVDIANANNASAGARTQAQIDAGNYRANQANTTKLKVAADQRANQVYLQKLRDGTTITAADIRAANTSSVKGPKHVKISVDIPAQVRSTGAGGAVIAPPQYGAIKTVTIEQWRKFLQKPVGQRDLGILGLPSGVDPSGKKIYSKIHYDRTTTH